MDESIRAATWQERAHAVALQIVEENYYLDLWAKVKPPKGLKWTDLTKAEALRPFQDLWAKVKPPRGVKWTDLTKAEALRPFQDLWEALPNSPAVRRPPFGQICSLAEEFCFGDDGDVTAAGRTVNQTLTNNKQAKAVIYLTERIDDKYAQEVCKMGQGAACCRYLAMGAQGWSCLKHSSEKDYIDQRVAANDFSARGDNCEGRAE